MKRMLLTATLVLSAMYLQAQTEQGRWMLNLHNYSPLLTESDFIAPSNSLGISFGNTKVDDEDAGSYTTIGLQAGVNYFIIDNLAAGINLGVFTQSTTNKADVKSVSTVFMAGPEMRYYFTVSDKTKVYIRGEAGFGTTESEIGGENIGEPKHLQQYEGTAGIAWFLAENFSVNLGIGFGANIAKQDIELLPNQFEEVKTVNSGVNLDLGFSFFFGG
ncbi:MAG: outer membrane beta-barrel protein [Saprospiraceae bacterium]|nr:outer membrane beta-barrel protein [Saprospiraceae bacterium]